MNTVSGTLRKRLARARELADANRAHRPPSSGVDAPEERSAETDACSRVTAGAAFSDMKRTEASGRLSGWREIAPFVSFRSVLRDNPLPDLLDLRPYMGKAARDSFGCETDLGAFPVERLLFFDLETTGLSGGSGTIAFLAAFGRALPGPGPTRLEIKQYFLADYPGEGDFLDALIAETDPGIILSSYNGRAFDEPLLKMRCVMNRRVWPSLRHVDFLHAARRLWRGRFPDCGLGTLESRLFGRVRTLDVPGATIPDIWLDYARTGSHPLMEAVLEHNEVDIESLAAIAAECSRIHSDPVEAEGCDLASLGRLWLTLDADVGVATLERSFSEGDERAGWTLLKRYRRVGATADYERILAGLSPSWDSCVERAKHAEHRVRDVAAAQEAACRALDFAVTEDLRNALSRRLARLERKAKRLAEDRRAPPR